MVESKTKLNDEQKEGVEINLLVDEYEATIEQRVNYNNGKSESIQVSMSHDTARKLRTALLQQL